MYLEHFGFMENPFSITPDTLFFLNQQSHKEALNTMLVALKHCEGFIKIVGEVGTGKTLLCRILLSRLNKDFVTVYVPNPMLTAEELKSFVAHEIGAVYDKAMQSHERMAAMYRKLVQLSRIGKHVVLVVDEAQAMPRDTIECLRLLTNLETEKRKLIQVVMLGQPELDVMLNRNDLRQLKQRIIFSEYIKPFSRDGVDKYIDHRIESAGCDRQKLFSSAAKRLVWLGCGGIPRLINVLCHKALICAYSRNNQQIKAWHVARAICDTDESRWRGKLCSTIVTHLFLTPAKGFYVAGSSSKGVIL